MKKLVLLMAMLIGHFAGATELVHGLEIARSSNCASGYAVRAYDWNYYYCAVNETGHDLYEGTYGDACIVFTGRGGGYGTVYVRALAPGRSAIVSCN